MAANVVIFKDFTIEEYRKSGFFNANSISYASIPRTIVVTNSKLRAEIYDAMIYTYGVNSNPHTNANSHISNSNIAIVIDKNSKLDNCILVYNNTNKTKNFKKSYPYKKELFGIKQDHIISNNVDSHLAEKEVKENWKLCEFVLANPMIAGDTSTDESVHYINTFLTWEKQLRTEYETNARKQLEDFNFKLNEILGKLDNHFKNSKIVTVKDREARYLSNRWELSFKNNEENAIELPVYFSLEYNLRRGRITDMDIKYTHYTFEISSTQHPLNTDYTELDFNLILKRIDDMLSNISDLNIAYQKTKKLSQSDF